MNLRSLILKRMQQLDRCYANPEIDPEKLMQKECQILSEVADAMAKAGFPLLHAVGMRSRVDGNRVKTYLSKCLRALQPEPVKPDMLSLRQAATLLGYTEKGLRKIVARKGIQFFQSRPWAPIKFKREWIDAFIMEHSTMQARPTARSMARLQSRHGSNWDL